MLPFYLPLYLLHHTHPQGAHGGAHDHQGDTFYDVLPIFHGDASGGARAHLHTAHAACMGEDGGKGLLRHLLDHTILLACGSWLNYHDYRAIKEKGAQACACAPPLLLLDVFPCLGRTPNDPGLVVGLGPHHYHAGGDRAGVHAHPDFASILGLDDVGELARQLLLRDCKHGILLQRNGRIALYHKKEGMTNTLPRWAPNLEGPYHNSL